MSTRQLLPATAEVQVGGFAGVLDPSRGPLWVRLLLRVPSKVSGIAPGDYRDWDAIGEWAADVRTERREQSPQPRSQKPDQSQLAAGRFG